MWEECASTDKALSNARWWLVSANLADRETSDIATTTSMAHVLRRKRQELYSRSTAARAVAATLEAEMAADVDLKKERLSSLAALRADSKHRLAVSCLDRGRGLEDSIQSLEAEVEAAVTRLDRHRGATHDTEVAVRGTLTTLDALLCDLTYLLEGKETTEATQPRPICVVCLGSSPKWLFQADDASCGHVGLCDDCKLRFRDRRCPICRGKVDAIVPFRIA